jgi:hypothetical protein
MDGNDRLTVSALPGPLQYDAVGFGSTLFSAAQEVVLLPSAPIEKLVPS